MQLITKHWVELQQGSEKKKATFLTYTYHISGVRRYLEMLPYYYTSYKTTPPLKCFY